MSNKALDKSNKVREHRQVLRKRDQWSVNSDLCRACVVPLLSPFLILLQLLTSVQSALWSMPSITNKIFYFLNLLFLTFFTFLL